MDPKKVKINRLLRIVRKPDQDALHFAEDNKRKISNAFKAMRDAKQYFKMSMGLLVNTQVDEIYNLRKNVRSDVKDILKRIRQNVKDNAAIPKEFYIEVVDRKLGKEPLLVGPFESIKSVENKKFIRNRILNAIRIRREELGYIEATNKQFKGLRLQMKGGVFTASDSILKLMKQLKRKKVTTDKVPLSKKSHVGIEIECYVNASDDMLTDDLIEANLQDNICMKSDGSLTSEFDEHSGIEFTLCDSEENFRDSVKKLCTILKKYDAIVDGTCGFHVHLDMRNRNANFAAKRLIEAQPFLFRLVPHSRRKNTFCLPTHPDQDFDTTGERYKAVNLAAYNEHSTIEIRLHSGTIEANKIINWIDLLIKIADTPMNKVGNPNTIPEWIDKLELNETLAGYVKSRALKFQTNEERTNGIKIDYQEFFKAAKFDRGEEDFEPDYNCDECGVGLYCDDAIHDEHGRDYLCQDCYDTLEDQAATERQANRN